MKLRLAHDADVASVKAEKESIDLVDSGIGVALVVRVGARMPWAKCFTFLKEQVSSMV
jgi:hypothetical protein